MTAARWPARLRLPAAIAGAAGAAALGVARVAPWVTRSLAPPPGWDWSRGGTWMHVHYACVKAAGLQYSCVPDHPGCTAMGAWFLGAVLAAGAARVAVSALLAVAARRRGSHRRARGTGRAAVPGGAR
jgi:hypothetical protein